MKTIAENCEVAAEGILKAIECATPYEWVEWDCFNGRQIYRKQSLRDAQKWAIQEFLEELVKK